MEIVDPDIHSQLSQNLFNISVISHRTFIYLISLIQNHS